MSFNLRRGLWRLWLAATALWLIAVVIENAASIGYWLGYNYHLLSRHDSLASALKEEERNKRIIEACEATRSTTCKAFPAPSDRTYVNEYARAIAADQACVESRMFLDALVSESKARGLIDASAIKRGEVCLDFLSMTIPSVNWARLSAAVLVPLLLLLLFAAGSWVVKGFARDSQRGV